MKSFFCKFLMISAIIAGNYSQAVYAGGQLPEVPEVLPSWEDNISPTINNIPVNIVPRIQNRLKRFLHHRGDPVAGLVLTEVRTGKILAFVQGASPKSWGIEVNTNLHNAFPAASLFKTIVAASALQSTNINSLKGSNLDGGCATVSPRGYWLKNNVKGRRFKINLRRAYGSSCNGFFARLAVNEIGLGPIVHMAEKFGWGKPSLMADFNLEQSPIKYPNPATASAHRVGRFAAGFGNVGLSVAHAAWQMLAITNLGVTKPMKLFSTPMIDSQKHSERILSKEASRELLEIMDATVLGGTATSAFKTGRYRKLRQQLGGKTGTLTGSHPKGVTTWFAGAYPLDKPEVAVASVVILKDLWHIKASNLAAEAILAYHEYKSSLNLAKSKDSKPSKN